jgi:uncharacterized protein GlcG (DUF336 family)
MMMRHASVVLTVVIAAALALGGCAAKSQKMDLGYKPDGPMLSQPEAQKVLKRAKKAALDEDSLLRVNQKGETQHTRMHIIVVDRTGKVIARHSMDDAWGGSVSIAKGKAYTAVAFSSDQNALTSRSIGALSQPSGPLWQIGNSNAGPGKPGLIEFPGGIPLYKDGQLVGAVGVSGDGVEQDENVAQAAAKPMAAPKPLRINTVTGGSVPYTK